jgi:hypothetical protein
MATRRRLLKSAVMVAVAGLVTHFTAKSAKACKQ